MISIYGVATILAVGIIVYAKVKALRVQDEEQLVATSTVKTELMSRKDFRAQLRLAKNPRKWKTEDVFKTKNYGFYLDDSDDFIYFYDAKGYAYITINTANPSLKGFVNTWRK